MKTVDCIILGQCTVRYGTHCMGLAIPLRTVITSQHIRHRKRKNIEQFPFFHLMSTGNPMVQNKSHVKYLRSFVESKLVVRYIFYIKKKRSSIFFLFFILKYFICTRERETTFSLSIPLHTYVRGIYFLLL